MKRTITSIHGNPMVNLQKKLSEAKKNISLSIDF